MQIPLELHIDDLVKYAVLFPVVFCPFYVGGDFFLPKDYRQNLPMLAGNGNKRYWVRAYLAGLVIWLPAGLAGSACYHGAKANPGLGLDPYLFSAAGGAFGVLISALIVFWIRSMVAARIAFRP